ncbi:hypothetical protein C8R45DRAFT_1108210 [Mycena sanguinolenta]|nr:hypothetical protein C8R45DRAFT_1108210 [Mycena sanguinolenta]
MRDIPAYARVGGRTRSRPRSKTAARAGSQSEDEDGWACGCVSDIETSMLGGRREAVRGWRTMSTSAFVPGVAGGSEYGNEHRKRRVERDEEGQDVAEDRENAPGGVRARTTLTPLRSSTAPGVVGHPISTRLRPGVEYSYQLLPTPAHPHLRLDHLFQRFDSTFFFVLLSILLLPPHGRAPPTLSCGIFSSPPVFSSHKGGIFYIDIDRIITRLLFRRC